MFKKALNENTKNQLLANIGKTIEMSKQFLANVLTIMVKHRSDRMAALTYKQ